MVNHTRRVARSLRAAGQHVSILAPRAPADQSTPLEGQDAFGTPYTLFPAPPKPRFVPFYLYWILTVRARLLERATKLMQGSRWDIVILYDSGWWILEPVRRLCQRRGALAVAYMVEWHQPTFRRLIGLSWFDQWLFHHWLLPKVDGLIGISRAWGAVAERHAIPFVVVPSFSKFGDDELPEMIHREGGPFKVAVVGHWVRRELPSTLMKGFALALKAGIQLELIVLGRAGSRPEEKAALRLLRNMPEISEHVKFMGWLDESAFREHLFGADAFVLLRDEDPETRALFPTRLPEYLATGKPVILSNAGDLALYVAHGVSAYVLPPGDRPQELADALVFLATHPSDARKIGLGGRKVVINAFSQTVLGQKLATFLSNLRERGDVTPS